MIARMVGLFGGKIGFGIFLSVAVALGGYVGWLKWSEWSYQQKISEQQTQIEQKKRKISDQANSIQNLRSNIQEYERELERRKKELALYQEHNQITNDIIGNLAERKQEIQDETTKLRARLSELKESGDERYKILDRSLPVELIRISNGMLDLEEGTTTSGGAGSDNEAGNQADNDS